MTLMGPIKASVMTDASGRGLGRWQAGLLLPSLGRGVLLNAEGRGTSSEVAAHGNQTRLRSACVFGNRVGHKSTSYLEEQGPLTLTLTQSLAKRGRGVGLLPRRFGGREMPEPGGGAQWSGPT